MSEQEWFLVVAEWRRALKTDTPELLGPLYRQKHAEDEDDA